jgi:Asp/Glu/hydantoin racemase
MELIAVSLIFPSSSSDKKLLAVFASAYNDRTLESYAQRLTINIIDALNSTSATAALSAKQGSILKGLVDSKANSTEFYDKHMSLQSLSIVSFQTRQFRYNQHMLNYQYML